jgi:hypothetical protein
MRIYFWSFAYGKTPHWIQAWSLRIAQTPEAKPQRGFATAPLQSFAQRHPFGVNAIRMEFCNAKLSRNCRNAAIPQSPEAH